MSHNTGIDQLGISSKHPPLVGGIIQVIRKLHLNVMSYKSLQKHGLCVSIDCSDHVMYWSQVYIATFHFVHLTIALNNNIT